MLLSKIHILNYRNLAQVDLEFSDGVNCFVGANGAGKTNLLDAAYHLSFCKSSTGATDSLNIRHGEPFMVLQGTYVTAVPSVTPTSTIADSQTETADGFCDEAGNEEGNTKGQTDEAKGVSDEIYCGVKRGCKKQFSRNKTEYRRISDHIGLIPLVLVSPRDEYLIRESPDARRRYMDSVISQADPLYLDALMRYNKILANRNLLLKQLRDVEEAGGTPDFGVLEAVDYQLAREGTFIEGLRRGFAARLAPLVGEAYAALAGAAETISVTYVTGLSRYNLYDGLRETHRRDLAVGYTTRGVHKDDLDFKMAGYPIKQVGSQGQCKSFAIALKLAQYRFLETATGKSPILLLDDVFDKLDAARGENLIRLVTTEDYGQIFISDTNRARLMALLERMRKPYRIYGVSEGAVREV